MAIQVLIPILLFCSEAFGQSSMPTDCADIYDQGLKASGVYTIYPAGPTSPQYSYCDMETDGGKWTVFQRRMDGSVNFYRGWEQYKNGFGHAAGEYWLGLEAIHRLTAKGNYELRVDMEDFKGNKAFAKYSSFSICNELDGYRLTVSGFQNGGAGDSLTYHNEQKFTTFDRDQDLHGSNCAFTVMGPFWHNSCYYANPNGLYTWGQNSLLGANWRGWKEFNSLKAISMKIRPLMN
ncbi:microfibril-associated glycoprotein 4-like [Alosa sapidissima]|uniref:microfibril-associated glycoprotein 4-like n=1 Tax=Alosa sapidissima TaxID=34773 RepID=UPI001C09A7C3|nr:microfibril-associated glycoprotein 4-like [Alosa sapidissima]